MVGVIYFNHRLELNIASEVLSWKRLRLSVTESRRLACSVEAGLVATISKGGDFIADIPPEMYDT